MDQYFSAVQQAAERSNAFNAEQAQMNRDWQAMMSNTAHQREVADLKSAGLNPVLSANSGASAPSGAQATANDTSGAIAGLLGQMINAQSAQAIAAANNSTAQLIETMKEKHDLFIHQNYPNSLYGVFSALANALTGGTSGQSAYGFLSGLAGNAWSAGRNLFYQWKNSRSGSSFQKNGRSGKF